MFVFCGRLTNFQKKKTKTDDDFYKSLIILLYSWLHTRGEKKKFLAKFYYFFSPVMIENLWKHLNLEFLTFNFIFWRNFISKNRDHPHYALTKSFDVNQYFHVIQPHATSIIIFSCCLISLGYLVLHFPFDLVFWDCCYKKFPRQTQK
jgi:hypothetical protein